MDRRTDARQHHAALEEQAQSILQQINDLRGQLAHVRAGQNELLPVNGCPNEVLLGIFALLVQPADSKSDDLIAISHTCTRWRTAALASPELWTQIRVCHHAQAHAFLERSGSLPVSMTIANTWPKDIGPIAEAIVPHIARLRSFSLSDVWAQAHMERWMGAMQGLAPLLEQLTLGLENYEKPREPYWMAGLPVFNRTLPSLRSLTLCGIYYDPWYDGFLGPNLRHLHLSTLPPIIDCPAFLRILLQCPGLETLTITACRLRGDVNVLVPIALPRLAQLELGYLFDTEAFRLLRNLDLPPTTKFHLHVHRMGEREHLAVVLPVYRKTLPALTSLRSLEIEILKNIGNRYIDQPFVLRANGEPQLGVSPTLTLKVDTVCEPSLAWIHRLGQVIMVAAVESYQIDLLECIPGAVFTATMWQQALEPLPVLRTLSIRNGDRSVYDGLLDALATAASNGQALCPLLEMLEIEGTLGGGGLFRTAVENMMTAREALPGNVPLFASLNGEMVEALIIRDQDAWLQPHGTDATIDDESGENIADD